MSIYEWAYFEWDVKQQTNTNYEEQFLNVLLICKKQKKPTKLL